MLALFAPKPYRSTADEIDLEAHLTNTCLQGDIPSNDSVRRFRDLPLPFKQVALVIERIGEIVGEAWQAALASGPQFQARAAVPLHCRADVDRKRSPCRMPLRSTASTFS